MLFDFQKNRINHIRKKLEPALNLEQSYKEKPDSFFNTSTKRFRQELQNGKTIDDLLPEVFATVREAARRVRGEFPYVEQMIGGYVLHQGNLAELATGEGKTLAATMPVYLNALEGKGVHVVTVNEYLAKRDAENMGKIYAFLGMTTGVIYSEQNKAEKKQAYNCDITYGTNSEFGFDYLRDNMVTDINNRVQRGLHYALVDEADSVLIDDARTPLIISGAANIKPGLYLQADRFVKSLNSSDYEIDVRSKTVHLTEAGISKAEKAFRITNLYDPSAGELVHCIFNALKANYTMVKDVDYLIDPKSEEILIVDPNTGRAMHGRQWSNGVHQAVEAKEGCPIQQETRTMATITYQNFFRLYDKLAGMTGTARTEAEEFLDIYNMRVVTVPTHRPVIRVDYSDVIYGTKKSKYEGLLNEVEERHKNGQPILVGTISIETSEILSKLMDKRHLPHNTLNAKNNEAEADIIALAGQKGAITIATNMAGRGTDIKLGDGVAELGGLCVLGSERHDSRRIDNQLRGRSGRQGDPGMSRFYVSLEDDLVKRFGSERLEKLFASIGDEKVESKTISRAIANAQKRVEGINFDARKQLLKYDNVIAMQRETMYEQRDTILTESNVRPLMQRMFRSAVEASIVTDENGSIDEEATTKALHEIGVTEAYNEDLSYNNNLETITDGEWNKYLDKVRIAGDSILGFEKSMLLHIIDFYWSRHIDTMDQLRNGIGLRGYAGDPLNAYMEEGTELFTRMSEEIARGVMGYFIELKVEPATSDEKENSMSSS